MNLIDYKRKKGILPPVDLGVIYAFTSNRKGCSDISEHLIWSIRGGHGQSYDVNTNVWGEFKFIEYDTRPGSFISGSINCNESYGQRDYYGSGFGDLWGSSEFISLDKKVLEELHSQESKRIEEKYK